MSRVRIWIAGPRSWEAVDPLEKLLRKLESHYGIARLLVMTGGATGVDHLVEEICVNRGIHVFRCRACWPVGRAAGPIRNAVIAEEFHPDVLIAVHYMPLSATNHRGTQNVIRQARKRGIPVKILHFSPETAMPSSVSNSAPMGTRARAERGLPPKPKKAKRARVGAKRSRTEA